MSSVGQLNHILTNVGINGNTTFTWKCINASTGQYRLVQDPSSAGKDITYHPTNGWSDHTGGYDEPTKFGTSVTDGSAITPPPTASTLYLWTNTALLCVLNTGQSSTGTETTNAAVGSFYNVTSTHFSWKVYHTSAFTTSQTYELHSTTLTPTFIADIVVGAPAQSINSGTVNWTIPDVVEIRDAYGTVLESLTLSNSTSMRKKVHCNFW